MAYEIDPERRPMDLSPDGLEALCRRLVHENPRQAEAYRQGRSMMGFFVGRVMTETNAGVSPQAAQAVLRLILDTQ